MRILWLKTELLHPVDKGGKIRTYNMLKELRRDHHITYLTLDDGSGDEQARELANEYAHELVCVPFTQSQKFTKRFYAELTWNLISSLPYAIKKYESPMMRSEISRRAQFKEFDVIVCDFLASAVNVPCSMRYPSVLFEHNIEAMIWKRHYEVQKNLAKKAYLYGQWRKMEAFEGNVARRFDTVITVSPEDRDLVHDRYQVPLVYDIPTGVDTDFFRPSGLEPRAPHNLVFTGSMDWLPNEDAIRYFTDEIMPLIKREVPDVTLTVVGRNPYPGLIELSQRDTSVLVTGRVEDVRPYMERAAVYVVPLRIGGGTRLKIYEAMAMEKAIVSTATGAEGLPLQAGTDLLLADTPASFADCVVRLLKDETYAINLGQRAAARVRQDFAWNRVAESFAAICENVASLTETATQSRVTLSGKIESVV